MIKEIHILRYDKIRILDRFGVVVDNLTWLDFMNSPLRLLDYALYFNDELYIKILEPIIVGE